MFSIFDCLVVRAFGIFLLIVNIFLNDNGSLSLGIKSDIDLKLDAIKSSLDKSQDETGTRLDTLDKQVTSMQGTISMLCAKLERQDTTISRLKHEVTDVRTHSMKYNLIFSFDRSTQEGREVDGEDCISVIKQFLGSVMSVPNASRIYIPVAHRLGKRVQGHTRAIVAKIPNASQLNLVLKHGSRLKTHVIMYSARYLQM